MAALILGAIGAVGLVVGGIGLFRAGGAVSNGVEHANKTLANIDNLVGDVREAGKKVADGAAAANHAMRDPGARDIIFDEFLTEDVGLIPRSKEFADYKTTLTSLANLDSVYAIHDYAFSSLVNHLNEFHPARWRANGSEDLQPFVDELVTLLGVYSAVEPSLTRLHKGAALLWPERWKLKARIEKDLRSQHAEAAANYMTRRLDALAPFTNLDLWPHKRVCQAMPELGTTVPSLKSFYRRFKALLLSPGTQEESVRLTVYEALLTLFQAARNRHPPADYRLCYSKETTPLIFTINFHIEAIEDDIRDAKRRHVSPAKLSTTATLDPAFWLNKTKLWLDRIERSLTIEQRQYLRTARTKVGLAP